MKKTPKDEADMGPTPSLTTENLPFSSGDSEIERCERRLRDARGVSTSRCSTMWIELILCLIVYLIWIVDWFIYLIVFNFWSIFFDFIFLYLIWLYLMYLIWFGWLLDCLIQNRKDGPCTTKSHPFPIRFFDSKNRSPKNQQSTTTWLQRLWDVSEVRFDA